MNSESNASWIVVREPVLDVRDHLAREECVWQGVAPIRHVVMFYRHPAAIVIGKNQNPWAETDVEAAEAAGIPVVRRISGGGTVYHDLGTLCVSFLCPRREYSATKNFAILVAALGDLGIRAELRDRTSLFVGERKVCGSAFALRGESALHHGTLLWQTDLAELRRWVPGRELGERGAAVPSRRAPVANLCEVRPDLTLEDLIDSIVTVMSRQLGWSVEERTVEDLVGEDWRAVRPRYDAWEWRFGRTPPFQTRGRHPVDGWPWTVWVEDGRVARVEGIGADYARAWIGRPYSPRLFHGMHAEADSLQDRR